MYHFFDAIANTKGDALIGYYVRAVDTVSGGGVSIYADQNSTPISSVSGIADAAKVDSDGNASFWIAGGEYHLDIYQTDGVTFVRRISSIPMIDASVISGNVSSRSQLAGLASTAGDSRYLTEAGREGTFVFDGANHSANVTNDPQQGIYAPPSSDTTGASGAWVRKFPGFYNVKWFGAKGDSSVGATGTDDTTAIQAAINYINTLGGGTLYFPEGFYLVSTYLTACKKLRILGSGRENSWFVTAAAGGGGSTSDQNLRNGSVIYSNWPSNSSTDASIVIEHIGFQSTNTANVGAAFYDNGGSYITIRDCSMFGFKYGIVFDQSELCDVINCNIDPENNSGACIWLLNGPDLKSGNAGVYTNRISVQRCQLNGGTTVNLIQDDGGYTHNFADNNYNGGNYQVRVAGAAGITIKGGEWESAANHSIYSGNTTAAGTGAGSSSGTINGGLITNASAHACLFNVAGSWQIDGGVQFSSSVAAIQGCSNAFHMRIGYAEQIGSGTLTDGTLATNHFEVGMGNTGNYAIRTKGMPTLVNGTTVIDANGNVIAPSYTFATLPASPVVGQKAFVTDANATTFASAVAGGGTNKVPVYYDGAWKIG